MSSIWRGRLEAHAQKIDTPKKFAFESREARAPCLPKKLTLPKLSEVGKHTILVSVRATSDILYFYFSFFFSFCSLTCVRTNSFGNFMINSLLASVCVYHGYLSIEKKIVGVF